jgi:pyridoxamine 5'-phosphate oxidase
LSFAETLYIHHELNLQIEYMSDYKDLRETYTKSELTEELALADPFNMFQQWMVNAINDMVPEPNAMVLSTVDENNIPHARTVLLKEIFDEKFVFYTNFGSNKAKQIEQNPNVTIVFLWLQSQRQVIVTGQAIRISEEKSTAYFQSRPRASQIGAWTSPQSSVIENREVLNNRRIKVVEKNHGKEKLDKPDFWGGYGIKPRTIEFWQGRDSRLHDRLKYTKSKDGKSWDIVRLAP